MPHFAAALSIIKTLQTQGFIAYFAGGWVRDFLLKHTSDDIDIVTDASVDEVRVLFPKTIPVGIQFGIVIVVIDEYQFEVATFRTESGYVDGRRPSLVEEATPKQDAMRRDFTINGMFYDPIAEHIYDYVDGQADIETRIIRAIGDPNERFKEDRLRMLRAIRYACRFNFTIESHTYEAIRIHAHELFPSVAIERVWQEFSKMAAFPHFKEALLMLHQCQLLKEIFPEIASLSYKELDKRLQGIEKIPLTLPTAAKISLVFGHITEDNLLAILKRMKISNKEIAFTLYFQKLKTLLLSQQILSKQELVYLYADMHFEICFEALKHLPMNETIIKKYEHHHIELEKHIKRVSENQPIIRGTTLIMLGFSPGKDLGDLLKQAEAISIQEDLFDETLILKRLGIIQP